jgi:hypothetical protein
MRILRKEHENTQYTYYQVANVLRKQEKYEEAEIIVEITGIW